MKTFMLTLWLLLEAKWSKKQLAFLKCDAKGCAYIEIHRKLDDTMVGKPCPLCESNLLTLEDYRDFVAKQ